MGENHLTKKENLISKNQKTQNLIENMHRITNYCENHPVKTH